MDVDAESRAAEALVAYGAATVWEAVGRADSAPCGIEPLWRPLALAGPAFTVATRSGENLALHRALEHTPAGSVLAVAAAGGHVAVWGEVLSVAARARGIRGLVTDAPVRDSDRIRELGFPVFCAGTSPRGPGKDDPGSFGGPIVLGGCAVAPGDWIVADSDGVVVVRVAELGGVLARAAERHAREASVVAALAEGASTLDLLDLRRLLPP